MRYWCTLQRVFFKVFIWVSIGILLSSCSMLSPVKVPEKNTFFFEPTIDVARAKRSNKTMLVSKPVSAAGYASSRMVYVQKPFELSYYTRNRWVDEPAKMLQPLIVQALQDSHHFRAVAATPLIGKTNNRIDTDLIYLRHDVMKQPSTVELAVQMQIIDTSNQQIIASRLFQTQEIVLINDPYHGVLAINRAIEKFLQDMVRFVLDHSKNEPE